MKRKLNKKYWNLPSIIFNLVETFLLITGAYLLKLNFINTLLIFLTFQISRAYFKLPKHYKKWQKCLVWTLIIFLSLFVIARVDISVGILTTIFTAYILSGKTDIHDMYMWSGKKTQYQDIIDYIRFNPLNQKIKEFEEKTQEQDNLSYLIYKYRFKDGLTFAEISKRLDIETNRITEIQDKVAFAFRVYIGL